MTALNQLLGIFLSFLLYDIVSAALSCYYCDNSQSAACGQDFKAYQFVGRVCGEERGVKGICGKQQQPPDKSGWIGIIRSCYYPGSGDLPGINETIGCHHYFHDKYNFTALYCFCDTYLCNHAPRVGLTKSAKLWTVIIIITISALVCRVLYTP